MGETKKKRKVPLAIKIIGFILLGHAVIIAGGYSLMMIGISSIGPKISKPKQSTIDFINRKFAVDLPKVTKDTIGYFDEGFNDGDRMIVYSLNGEEEIVGTLRKEKNENFEKFARGRLINQWINLLNVSEDDLIDFNKDYYWDIRYENNEKSDDIEFPALGSFTDYLILAYQVESTTLYAYELWW